MPPEDPDLADDSVNRLYWYSGAIPDAPAEVPPWPEAPGADEPPCARPRAPAPDAPAPEE